MRRISGRVVVFAGLLLCICGQVRGAPAQKAAGDTKAVPVMRLDGPWRFHAGDDPRWAAAGFDDSAWPQVEGDKDYVGTGWYRLNVALPPGVDGPLALQPRFNGNFEIFANGQRAGGCGAMPPAAARTGSCPAVIYDLPEVPAGSVLTLAVRVWSDVPGKLGRPGAGFVGQAGEMAVYAQAAHDALQRNATQDEVLLLLEGLSALFALGLFLLNQADREYLWFGMVMVFAALGRFELIFQAFHAVSFASIVWWENLLFVAYRLTLVTFLYVMLGGRRSWWLNLAIFGTLLEFTLPVVLFTHFGGAHAMVLNFARVAGNLICSGWIIAFVVRRAMEGELAARLLVVPVLLSESITNIYLFVFFIARLFWHYPIRDVNQLTVISEPFTLRLEALGDLLLMFAMLAILMHRFVKTHREEERFAGELEAARSVQQLLLPSVVPETPGFAVESVYMPAQEVGGDFFYVSPGEDGSVLVVVGDVSGKGLSAAMSVSAVIGALRSCVGRGPAQVLRHLNGLLHGHINGFATCCAALLERDGALRVANAGHLSPYRNGDEMELEGGLPLGLVGGADYEEVQFGLAAGDRLTFLSDGVVEAMNPAGELFGFERTRAISRESAVQVAAAARAFGQEDDITVVAVSYLGV